jgi:hypothetical protein
MGKITKSVQETEKIQYEISVLLIRYRTGDSQKFKFFIKIQMKTVLEIFEL